MTARRQSASELHDPDRPEMPRRSTFPSPPVPKVTAVAVRCSTDLKVAARTESDSILARPRVSKSRMSTWQARARRRRRW